MTTTPVSRWREILRDFVYHNAEGKENAAREIGVSPRTIDRWITKKGSTDPERRHIPKIAKSVPGREEEMRLSLSRDYPDAFVEHPALDRIMIPSPMYRRPLEALATSAGNLARPTVKQIAMKQMVAHLDPNGVGIMVLFAQCVKPTNGDKVTGLHVHTGYGTNNKLWLYRQIEHPFMAGNGSLCAMAILNGDFALFPEHIKRINYTAPVLHGEALKEGSCAALPVLREGKAAGALFIGSALPEFFIEERRELIRDYSYLFALGLRDDEFYSMDEIELQALPTIAQQGEIYLYAQRILDDLSQKFPDDTTEQLEARAWQIFHEECSSFPRKDAVNAE